MSAKNKKEQKILDSRIKAIANKIRQLRIDAGYTSSEIFSYENELSRVHYWRIEKGTNLTFESFLKILDIHQISLEDFFQNL